MTNSSPHRAACEWLLGLLTAGLTIAAIVMLWRTDVDTNGLVITAGIAGWVAAAYLAHARDRDAGAFLDERDRQYEQARAVEGAVGGRPTRLIGDAERDVVLAELGRALEAGRIRLDEHAERSGAALDARTPADLRATLRGLL